MPGESLASYTTKILCDFHFDFLRFCRVGASLSFLPFTAFDFSISPLSFRDSLRVF